MIDDKCTQPISGNSPSVIISLKTHTDAHFDFNRPRLHNYMIKLIRAHQIANGTLCHTRDLSVFTHTKPLGYCIMYIIFDFHALNMSMKGR